MNMLFSVSTAAAGRRLDWGFDNPNKTAALIATLLVAAWFAPQFFRWLADGLAAQAPTRRWARVAGMIAEGTAALAWIAALLASALFAWHLLRTGSRGGTLAAACGLLCTAGTWFFLRRRGRAEDVEDVEDTGGAEVAGDAGGGESPRATTPPNAAAAAIAPAAAAVVIASAPPRRVSWFFKIKCAAVALLVCGAVGTAFFLPQTARFSPAHGAKDASIGNRWLIWKNIPALMAEAPEGWGLGTAGEVFMEWKQPPERNETYRTLVNSHGTWLVEFGWLARLGYLAAWLLAFRLAWPWRSRRRRANAAEKSGAPFDAKEKHGAGACDGAAATSTPAAAATSSVSKQIAPTAPLGVLVAFFLAAAFSSVAEEWQLWIAPAAAVAAVFLLRIASRQFPSPRQLALSVLAPAVALCAVFWGVGILTSAPRLRVEDCGRTVRVGSGEPRLWIAAGAGTRESARGFRAPWGEAGEPFAWAWVVPPPPPPPPENGAVAPPVAPPPPVPLPAAPGATLAVFGAWDSARWLALAESARRVVFISPQFPPDAIPASILEKSSVYFGEFSSESHHALAWREKRPCTVLPGMSDFLQNWPEILLAEAAEGTNNASRRPETFQ